MIQSIPNVRLIVLFGEVWLEFTASDGTMATLNIGDIAQQSHGRPTNTALALWCEDRVLDSFKAPWSKSATAD